MANPLLTAILIDDEQDSLDLLNWQLGQECPEVEVVARINNAHEGLQCLLRVQPDIIFLDIEMPGMNGLQLLEQCDRIAFDPVFTTAYDQYALRAIKLGAFDYLLKPVQRAELRVTVDKIIQKRARFQPCIRPEAVKIMLDYFAGNRKDQKITIHTNDEVHFIEVSDLLYLQAENNYTHLTLKSGKRLLVAKTLKYFEALLTENGFFRVHASYLINLAAVSSIRKGEDGGVVLKEGSKIPIARGRRDELLRLL